MKVLSVVFLWLLCLAGLALGSACKSEYFNIREGVRISGTPKTESTVNDEISCAILCGRDENCGCCNIINEIQQLMCQLFDNNVCEAHGNTIKDDRTTVYSVFDVKLEPERRSNSYENPTVNSTTLDSTPTKIMSPSTFSLSPSSSVVAPSTPSMTLDNTPTQIMSSTFSPSPSLPVMMSSTTSVEQNPTPVDTCRKIYQNDTLSKDGSYSMTGTTNKVFCDMTGAQTGCGGGGWTLVMKINGACDTFAYDSDMWTSKEMYQPYYAERLSVNEESKAETYWTASFTQMCLGMSYDVVGWTIINMTGSSLFDLISSNSHHATNITVSEWKKMIQGSPTSLQPNCPVQGINVRGGDTGVRIGIIATKTCGVTSDYNSRLGFGGKGYSCGQDGTNSCGNEARCCDSPQSHKTFGYILVK